MKGVRPMSTVKDDSFDDCNVIYSECCFTMGTRFHELSGKYKQLGKLDLAEKLEAESVIQLDAWRKARDEVKKAG
jgi:hypothetical protein